MSDNDEEYTKRIAEFISITGASAGLAQKYLENSNFDVQDALQEYFEESVKGNDGDKDFETERPSQGPFSSSSSGISTPQSGVLSKKEKPKKKFRTFQELMNGGGDGSDDDDETNFFTGGEKSALQVENPNKNNNPLSLVQDILKKAADPGNGPRGKDDEAAPKKKLFTGTGFKLGDSETPSTVIPEKTSFFQKPPKVERKITFWKDGFSVGDGPLYRYDDPRNGAYLRDLNSGRAPLELLDVKLGQDVDVTVDKRLDENYTPPKRKVGGFHGSGQRLGSPVPGETVITTEPTPVAPSATPSAKPDEGEGDCKLQIRFADGRRVVRKFNSTDSVQTVYDFVSSETSDSRLFFLSLSFPVKPLNDMEISIKEAGLVNAALIQRWK